MKVTSIGIKERTQKEPLCSVAKVKIHVLQVEGSIVTFLINQATLR